MFSLADKSTWGNVSTEELLRRVREEKKAEDERNRVRVSFSVGPTSSALADAEERAATLLREKEQLTRERDEALQAFESEKAKVGGSSRPSAPFVETTRSPLSAVKLTLPALQKFSGADSVRLTDWVSDAQNLTAAAGLSVEDAVKLTALYLIGHAQQVWRVAFVDI